MSRSFRHTAAMVAIAALIGAACASGEDVEPSPAATSPPAQEAEPSPAEELPDDPVAAVVAFDESGATPSQEYRIAYITECATENAYCLTRVEAMDDAAAKYGFTYQTFNSTFNPSTQLAQVQDAVAGDFDGFLFAPTAGAPSCQMWQQHLVPTGKPVVSLDIPMCGDDDYTEGLAATVTMQSQRYFFQHVDNAFASCTEPCQVAAIGGFTGSDLFGYWEAAIEDAAAQHPNVTVVVDQPANFDPNVAQRVIADALVSHPDIDVVISSWDQMTLGAETAIRAAGKTPGTDIRIYSIGGTADAIQRVVEGTWNETTILLPYEEGYYAAVALIMALEGQPVNGYVNEAELPAITEGPGTIFITADNADQFSPRY
jgi:ABC-type sugar transport system substrate-binding protein